MMMHSQIMYVLGVTLFGCKGDVQYLVLGHQRQVVGLTIVKC